MMEVGRVISSEVEENRGGETNVLMLQVELSDENDIQSVEYFRQPGIDVRPNEDAAVLVDNCGEAWKVTMAADDNIEPSVDEGEIAIYASDGVTKQSQVYCKNDGTIEAGLANLDFVAIASKILSELQTIADKFNAHVHLAVGSPSGPPIDSTEQLPVIYVPGDVASSNLKAEE